MLQLKLSWSTEKPITNNNHAFAAPAHGQVAICALTLFSTPFVASRHGAYADLSLAAHHIDVVAPSPTGISSTASFCKKSRSLRPCNMQPGVSRFFSSNGRSQLGLNSVGPLSHLPSASSRSPGALGSVRQQLQASIV